MPVLKLGATQIHYELQGKGYPVFLLAPGFLSSRIERWRRDPSKPDQPQDFLDPIPPLAEHFKVIALDIRNAGASRGPVGPTDSWNTYISDYLALIDYVGAEKVHVMGACIGVSFAFALAAFRPGLVSALVLQNPIGLHENREMIDSEFNAWAKQVVQFPEVDAANVPGFHQRMFGNDFLFAVSRDFVRSCKLPIMLLPGNDTMHPKAISAEIADLAPHAEIVDPWKGPQYKQMSMDRIADFLIRNEPKA
jgi:pimeloyl-ACP methyl ester carboxylesterase